MVLGDREVMEEDLARFVYTRAVFMETFRLYLSSFGLIL